MKKIFLYTLFLAASCVSAACGGSGADTDPAPVGPVTPETPTQEVLSPQCPSKTNGMKVFAHYMPWFVKPSAAGVWNHWTMSADALNSTNYASWYHPLTGAYASDDSAILDYQCLLMKYTGIDGVMVDWYGTQQKNDYPQNESNTKALLKAVERAGMKLAIVYEDATLSGLDDSEKQAQARRDMQYLSSDYFKSTSYVKVDGRPLLLCFGPQQLTSPKGWSFAFGTLVTKPQFVVLNGFSHCANDAANTNSQGEFLWVNPQPTYSDKGRFGMYIGGAMPGFHDHYKASGQGDGYTTYDREDGALFQRQLEAVRNAGLDWVQLSTWNDYGEGTIIEPTTEFKYHYLELVQTFAGVSYTSTHLNLIYRWYQVAKIKGYSHSDVQQAYDYLNALQPDKAETIIKKLE